MNRLFLFKLIIILIICFSKISVSEPFVVLEYRGQTDRGYNNADNLFLRDLNFSSKHLVLKDETLSDIMLKYYGSKSFNQSILSLAIVHFNKKAFVRNNPNFLFSGKNLYLPSINEIKNLIIKKNKNQKENFNQSPLSSQIYFFGG
jgi:Tfp pilus assembly protein FimV